MNGGGAHLNTGINSTVDTATCIQYLRSVCVAKPSQWDHYMLYSIPSGGKDASTQCLTDYTVEFLLTRGAYALLGYTWYGCTNGHEAPPRAAEWDQDFGEPADGSCHETSTGSGVFTRAWTQATVTWDCAARHGTITRAGAPGA